MAEARRPDGPLSWLGLGVVVATVVDRSGRQDMGGGGAARGRGDRRPADPLALSRAQYRHRLQLSRRFRRSAADRDHRRHHRDRARSSGGRAEDGGRWATVGYALIIGGALGNLIDRILHGYVVDFLLLHFGDWTLFVFNLADAALTLGPAILLIVYLWPWRAGGERPAE